MTTEQTDLELLTTYLENVSTWAVEYETEHEDSAGNYADLLMEDSQAIDKLRQLLGFSPSGIYGLRNAMDRVEAKQSYTMCSPSDDAVASYAVGEVETQLEISVICAELDLQESVVRSLLNELDRDFCILGLRDSSDTFEIYNNTDNIWEFVLTPEAKTDCLLEFLAK